jgi:hypothetical protein
MSDMGIFTNAIAQDAYRAGKFRKEDFPNLLFSRRVMIGKDFQKAYHEHYGEEPKLQADLGYAAVHLLVQALDTPSPLKTLRDGIAVHGEKFIFDENQALGSGKLEVRGFGE